MTGIEGTQDPCSCRKLSSGQASPHGVPEYIRDSRLGHQRSAVAETFIETKHDAESYKKEVVVNINTYCPPIISEAIEVIRGTENFNRENRCELRAKGGS
jgi:hypothetical protein